MLHCAINIGTIRKLIVEIIINSFENVITRIIIQLCEICINVEKYMEYLKIHRMPQKKKEKNFSVVGGGQNESLFMLVY